MPKRHRLFQDDDYDDIPTPISSKRPIEKPNVAPTKKVERRNEAKQKSDNEIEAHSKTPADDEDSDFQVLNDRTRKKKKMKKPDNVSSSCRKSSDSDSDDDYIDCLKNKSSNLTKTLSLKMPYTAEEDKMIVRYVMQFNRILETTSVNLWKRLEKTRGLDGNFRARPWQSLKNRFLRNIVPHLFTKFKHLLDERNMEMALDKFPKLRDGMKKSQIEALLKEGRNRSERNLLKNGHCQNGKSNEVDDFSEGISKLHKSNTSTPLSDIKNKNDTRLRQENNDLSASEFNNNRRKLVSKSEVKSARKKKKVVEEVIRIEETSEEEELEIANKTPEDLLQEFIDEQYDKNMEVEEETQLQGEPCNFSQIPNLTDSEYSIPVNIDSEMIVVDNGPSQSLLFRDANKEVMECEKVKEMEVEGEVKKIVRLRKKRCYKPLHSYSIMDRLAVKQILISILRAKKRKSGLKIKRKKNKVKRRTKEDESGSSEGRRGRERDEDKNESEDKRKDEERDEEGKGRESDEDQNESEDKRKDGEREKKMKRRDRDTDENESEGDKGKDGEREEEVKGRESDEGENESESDNSKGRKENVDDRIKEEEMDDQSEAEDERKKTGMEPEEEVQILNAKNCNMLEYYTKKALKHYETLISDDSDSDSYLRIEKFTNEMTAYTNSLIFKCEISLSDNEDNSPSICNDSYLENDSTANCSQLSANEKSDTSIDKLNLSNSSGGLLGNMYSMLSEKEKQKIL